MRIFREVGVTFRSFFLYFLLLPLRRRLLLITSGVLFSIRFSSAGLLCGVRSARKEHENVARESLFSLDMGIGKVGR